MKLSRRELASIAAVTALAAKATAQETDLTKAARETNQRISETLARFEIPLSTEPAFQFKA